MTVVYSFLHMLVDAVCALSMFGCFWQEESKYLYLFLYNFCAFALQMPFGVVLDMLGVSKSEKKEQLALDFALTGVLFTIVGAFVHPVLLGIGNALFHVGGGVGSVKEDAQKGWQGRGLGVFVAPGALGLYLGTVIAKKDFWQAGILACMMLLILGSMLAGVLLRRKLQGGQEAELSQMLQANTLTASGTMAVGMVMLCCLSVVILRSYIGMAVSFSWKEIPILGLLSVLAVVGGKVAGGFLAARFGYRKTIILSLGLAAVCYLGLEAVPFGIAALLLFNMTMPMTLYLLIKTLPGVEGFGFGLLTFGLFLGFLPVYFGMELPVSGQVLGFAGSLLSMLLLLLVAGRKEKRGA